MVERRPNWIRTDASSDLLNSLEHCLLTFTLARSDERNWKWSVATAHSAAQIAMVMVLVKSDEHLTLKSRKAILDFYERGRTDQTVPWPRTKLANFMDLYDACAKRLPKEVATPEHREEVERLNWLRNHWTHFSEDASSISVGLARIAVRAGIKLVTELLPSSPDGLYRTHTDTARYEAAISTLLRLLEAAEMDDQESISEEKAAIDAAIEAQLAAYGDDDEPEE